jgi:hypothetical protein
MDKLDEIKEALGKVKVNSFEFDKDLPEITAQEIQPLTTTEVSALFSSTSSYTITISTMTSGSYLTSSGIGNYAWNTTAPTIVNSTWPTSITSPSPTVEITGDLVVNGKNIGSILDKIQDRLAILDEPDPEKLEKHAALRKAYDHYKLMEKLIGEE